MVLEHIFVAVPVDARLTKRAAGKQLHESDSSFEQPARQKAAPSEFVRRLVAQAVHLVCRLRLGLQIGNLGDDGLHASGKLVASDAGLEQVASSPLAQVAAIHVVEQFSAGLLVLLGKRPATETGSGSGRPNS